MRSKLRVIAGQYRNRPIQWSADHIRPTPNVMRERLYNWIQFTMREKTFLDLFSGTGILGIEALSRGAHHVTFIDKDFKVCQDIRQNLTTLEATEKATVLTRPIPTPIDQNFDFILCDPPYDYADFPGLLIWLDENFQGATLYLESSSKISLELPKNWQILKTAKQGLCSAALIKI